MATEQLNELIARNPFYIPIPEAAAFLHQHRSEPVPVRIQLADRGTLRVQNPHARLCLLADKGDLHSRSIDNFTT